MMANYAPTIGLEVHAELRTRTKMFCDSLNDPDEKHPNVNVCPVCLGHPGTLPTINKQAVEAVIKAGLAINGKINPITKFDRKNYFYPDLPKGYQISQYDEPIVKGGSLTLQNGVTVRIHRIHLEEDAGRLVHGTNLAEQRGLNADTRGNNQREHASYVDFNRAGVPLMELVTEPDMHTTEDAVALMKELQLIFRYIGVSDADLERGQMRADANISIAPKDATELGTKVEIKNLNSFRAVASAIRYEIKRHTEVLEKGEKIHQETRGWDEAKQKTVSQRSKEESHDYRYFPEPDLPPFEPTKVFDIEDMRRHLPELPEAKRARFQKEFGLSAAQAEALVREPSLASFFEEAISELAERDKEHVTSDKANAIILLFNYLTSDLTGLMNEMGIGAQDLSAGGEFAFGGKITPEHLAHLVDFIVDGKIMSRQAKDILAKMVETGDDPEGILNAEGLHTVSDEAELEKVVQEVIAENPAAVADYVGGKTTAIQFLIGKAMGKLKGRGNPEQLRELLTNLLK